MGESKTPGGVQPIRLLGWLNIPCTYVHSTICPAPHIYTFPCAGTSPCIRAAPPLFPFHWGGGGINSCNYCACGPNGFNCKVIPLQWLKGYLAPLMKRYLSFPTFHCVISIRLQNSAIMSRYQSALALWQVAHAAPLEPRPVCPFLPGTLYRDYAIRLQCQLYQ